jgi:hypothetical protein
MNTTYNISKTYIPSNRRRESSPIQIHGGDQTHYSMMLSGLTAPWLGTGSRISNSRASQFLHFSNHQEQGQLLQKQSATTTATTHNGI